MDQLPANDIVINNLKRQHSWRTPAPDAKIVLRDIRQRFLDLSIYLADKLPPSRELSCALTKLDEARMWASNAATLNGTIVEDLVVNRPT